MCVAQCGVVAMVEDGRFTKVTPDSKHPNGGICIKGYAAPEIVYSPDRLLHPMKRTRPKGDPDPGWVEISWQEALDTVTRRLLQIKEEHGPEAVVFGRSTPAGSAASDFEVWLIRLANAFGSPNVLATTHICLLWGTNPLATFPTSAQRIRRARARGAKLIVIDPRQHRLAREADYWLRVRPGSDAALALSMIHVLIEDDLYDQAFVRTWTNGPFLVRDDTKRLLRASDLSPSATANGFVVWDMISRAPVVCDPAAGYGDTVQPALDGTFLCRLGDREVACQPAFTRGIFAPYTRACAGARARPPKFRAFEPCWENVDLYPEGSTCAASQSASIRFR